MVLLQAARARIRPILEDSRLHREGQAHVRGQAQAGRRGEGRVCSVSFVDRNFNDRANNYSLLVTETTSTRLPPP